MILKEFDDRREKLLRMEPAEDNILSTSHTDTNNIRPASPRPIPTRPQIADDEWEAIIQKAYTKDDTPVPCRPPPEVCP